MRAAILLVVGILLAYGSAWGAGEQPSGRSTVFLISMDGIRPDYIPRSETPFIDQIMKDGTWSMALAPAFPTLTFPTHTTLATGTLAGTHGVTGNSFYDNRTGETEVFPGDSSLLEAEPIWTTATRQGVRVLVLDWVLAHQQSGPHAAEYSGQAYTRGISDEERIGRVLETWAEDDADNQNPLRLIMAYGESPDKEGHQFGPEAPELETTMAEVDALLERTYEQAKELWSRTAQEGDSLYFVLVSDHGMSRVDYSVNLSNATGVKPNDEDITLVTGGNVGHVFLDRLPEEQRAETAVRIMANLEKHDFLNAYRREDLPERWGLRHDHRVGDLFVELHKGHAFTRRPLSEVREPHSRHHGPVGTHGYDPETNPEMKTVLVVHRYPEPLNGGDVGEVHADRVHATIAQILGIQPSPQANPSPVPLRSD